MKTPVMTPDQLRATHWHKSDVEAWGNVKESIPAIIESNLKLWSIRIERDGDVAHLPHQSLFIITATHYALRPDGVSAPDGPELTMAVAAESIREARTCVTAQLDAHGLNGKEWALGSTTVPLILSANPES